MGLIGWLLQWPVRAVVLLLVAAMPLGVELAGFQAALTSAVTIGLLGTLLILPLKFVLAFPWAVTSLGGLIAPVSWLFDWLITVILFGLASALIDGFRLKDGLRSAVLGAVAYSVISAVFIRVLGLADVGVIRAAVGG
ncbi:phage holin family protein [Synechococcus sp. UW179A]|uniref:phage holin family protein n=1 Tax=Synechococcus sp. UW179A TaxID=2575510 RepID=UPI000E0FE70A|nr:phage holin family protein [Synechococcus sp. UW179A]